MKVTFLYKTIKKVNMKNKYQQDFLFICQTSLTKPYDMLNKEKKNKCEIKLYKKSSKRKINI